MSVIVSVKDAGYTLEHRLISNNRDFSVYTLGYAGIARHKPYPGTL